MMKPIVRDIFFPWSKVRTSHQVGSAGGKKHKTNLQGWTAQIAQHEIDHLNGIII